MNKKIIAVMLLICLIVSMGASALAETCYVGFKGANVYKGTEDVGFATCGTKIKNAKFDGGRVFFKHNSVTYNISAEDVIVKNNCSAWVCGKTNSSVPVRIITPESVSFNSYPKGKIAVGTSVKVVGNYGTRYIIISNLQGTLYACIDEQYIMSC